MKIGEIAWEEFQKIWFPTFREFAEMGMAYVKRPAQFSGRVDIRFLNVRQSIEL